MNIYICTTLRHLLFSIAKASNEPNKKSQILFFYDYQGIDTDALDTTNLPKNIKLTLLSRKKLTKKLKLTFKGKLYLALSLRMINLPKFIKKKLILEVNDLIPEIELNQQKLNLFVFNERNKMSRLFRMMVSTYEMIEDGVGNYYEIPVQFPKNIIRFFQGKKPSSWVFGESKRCKSINAVFPEKLPRSVIKKGKEIDFLNSQNQLEIINKIFKFTPSNSSKGELFIIATQPPSKKALKHLKDKNFLYKLNQEIINYCDNNNIAVVMKTHPKENAIDYQKFFPMMTFLPSKYPLELQILNSTNKVTIVSINSSAGLGFEKYCSRLKLIPDHDLHQFVKIISDWEKDIHKLRKTIETTFKSRN